MITVIITAYKEPKTIGRAIEAMLQNKTREKYELLVVAPDRETAAVAKRYKGVKYFKDPGKGKSNALNQVFKRVKSNIIVLTDGDVFVDHNALQTMFNTFHDQNVGCISGRPVAINSKQTMLGYFSHLLVDAGAHNIRKKLYQEKKFLECSGYLFAFRNTIKNIPTDVAEDSYIPYLFWKKGYTIAYAEQAKVYVKYPETLKDFIKQKTRTAKSHVQLKHYAPDFPSVKSFWNEMRFGVKWAMQYPRNPREIVWTLMLFPVRLYIWWRAFLETNVSRKHYTDAWERIESTK